MVSTGFSISYTCTFNFFNLLFNFIFFFSLWKMINLCHSYTSYLR
ncbi:hypothetical protein H249_5249 [Klebsiella pneumoniae VAKPC270]|nr:hypothetical protein H249_5249 [Klebsiella pneumoniae VAKPC270]EOZ53466.1 hypothetical protein H252_5334 [Klebsiella pneumoniae VAKPC309]EOZ53721.1 hypothetical protein H250_5194 [Klebsiella pneumoniae VAKPC276]